MKWTQLLDKYAFFGVTKAGMVLKGKYSKAERQ
jgi:hypothetical protein